MIDAAEFILGRPLDTVRFVSFRQCGEEKTDDDEIRKTLEAVDRGAGVLVLTDISGASPCNYVARLLSDTRMAVVSGLNLAMLIRVWNYRDKPLRQLVDLATAGAIRDIGECSS